MTTFPKRLLINSEPTISPTQLQTAQPYQITHRNWSEQGSVLVTDEAVFINVLGITYKLESKVLMTPEFSHEGKVHTVKLEYDGESLSVSHSQIFSMQQLYGGLIKVINHKGFNDFYKPLKRLGRGNFATVYLVQHKFNGKVFAAKVFGKCQQFLQEDGKQALQNEIDIMRSVDHNNIVRIYGVHQTENLIYLIIEYLNGGTLEDYMRSRLNLQGHEIVSIIKQIACALDYLNQKNIMHRDLKPANIMRRKETGEWVITDFGLAAKSKSKYLYQKCGTPGFVAPEILKLQNQQDTYTQKCDMFSFGVIVYTLIFGKQPFLCNSVEQMYELNKNCEIKIGEREKEELHPDIIKFILGVMEADPSKRLTPEGALESPLLKNSHVTDNLIKYFQNQRERAMSKVLKWANHVNN